MGGEFADRFRVGREPGEAVRGVLLALERLHVDPPVGRDAQAERRDGVGEKRPDRGRGRFGLGEEIVGGLGLECGGGAHGRLSKWIPQVNPTTAAIGAPAYIAAHHRRSVHDRNACFRGRAPRPRHGRATRPGCPRPGKPLPIARPHRATRLPRQGSPKDCRMIRFLVRLVGFLLVAAAFVALVIDGIRSIAAEQLVIMPLGEAGFRLFPRTFPLIEPALVRHVHPFLWDPIVLNLLTLPTWLVTGLLGILLLWLGRRRPAPVGVLTRP